MKTLLLKLLLGAGVLGALPAQAQSASWGLPGATWEYGYALFSVRGTLTVRYANDTVVGGQTAQVLRRVLRSVQYPGPTVLAPEVLPSIITRVVGNDVSFWHNGQFVPLYQFGAQPGSSWTTYATYPYGVCPQIPLQVVVDSVGQRLVGGRTLRWQAVHCMSSNWQGRIYEGIGSVISMQPSGGNCPNTDPGYFGPLLSFRASGFPAVGGPSLAVLATAEARAAQAGFLAYPSPTAGLLTVELPAAMQAATLVLRDAAGRVVWRQPPPAGKPLSLSGLPPGSYWLTAERRDQGPLTRRVVVE